MDGTFRCVNNPWKQLFSIHGFVKSGSHIKQIPLVFVIMSGKRKEDYYQVLRFIDRKLPEHISLEGFVADFEAALWQALKERFPRMPIQGSAFHWTQAVFRKVQEHGLQTAYNRKDKVFKFVHQLLALPFLPPEHIKDTFHRLDGRATEVLAPVMDYVYRTWIRSPIYEIHHWSVFMTAIRTNNDVEGWHNRLNTNVATRGPVPFYHLIVVLYRELGYSKNEPWSKIMKQS
ncbi:uncharacterized protein LOC134242130 [Saccostrea cucullata]|uniref:uncharacterized protein LOC134242130 n=1 Tax=Saccostrea cuccullata TaxID=36930 RepID=UPI002ED14DF4